MNDLDSFKKYLEERESFLLGAISVGDAFFAFKVPPKELLELNRVSCALNLITEYQTTSNY